MFFSKLQREIRKFKCVTIFQEAKVELVEGEITEAAYRAQEVERAAEKDEAEAARYAAELAKVMSPEELQRFERLSVQELQQMSFDQLAGSSFR